MNDQQIMSIVNELGNIIDNNTMMANRQTTEILKIIEEIRPGSIEDFQKRMFKLFCFRIFITNRKLRQSNDPNALQMIAHNNGMLEKQKQEAQDKGWMDVYQKAAEEAHHYDMESTPQEGIIKP